MTEVIDITERAKRINSAYKAEQAGYVKLCKSCAEAEELPRDDKDSLYKLLSFSKSRFSKYARIGQNDFLLSSEKILTGCYSIDYEIARLDRNDIIRGFEKRVLHRDCSREDVLKYKASIYPRHAPKKRRVIATVSVPVSASQELQGEVWKILILARRLEGVKVVEPENKKDKAKNDYIRQVDLTFRTNAKLAWRLAPAGKIPAERVQVVETTLKAGSNAEIAEILSSIGADPETIKTLAFEAVTVPPIVLERHTEDERKSWISLGSRKVS